MEREETVPTYESSLRFARSVYGVLALIGFFLKNPWLILISSLIMTVGVIKPNDSNFVYQFHLRFIRPLLKERSLPILRRKGDLRFACLLGTFFLLGAFFLIEFNKFPEMAWILVLILSFFMLLSGISGFCIATLFYLLVTGRIFRKKLFFKFPQAKFGTLNYVNSKCIVARLIGAPPWRRCIYCRLESYRKCPMHRFLLITLFLLVISGISLFILEKENFFKLFEITFLHLSFFAIVYGYFFNKNTCEILEREHEIQKVLEIRVRAKTKQLQELAQSLEEKVKERTKELQKAKEELEEKVKELQRWYELTVNRELRMKELKEKIKELENKEKR